MIALTALWLPILVSAVLVFIASSVIHMVLPYHRSDFAALPDEEGVRTALGSLSIPPGEYFVPHATGPGAMKDPVVQERMRAGPVLFMTVLPDGLLGMGTNLIGWFVYCLVVGAFTALIAGSALGAGASYHEVFHFAGLAAFGGYALALWQNTIWYKRPVSTTLKSTFDGLVYAALTAGVFGWLWPS